MIDRPCPEPSPNAAAPQATSVAAADWPDLTTELDRWGETGRIASLWWRDDDAADATPQLGDLLRIAGGTPIALAVIPLFAAAGLPVILRDAPAAVMLQHGWRHVNRAVEGKKSEYPKGLPASVVAAEIVAGRDRLVSLFGSRALPIFVPPWNRIAPELLPVLPDAEIAFVSTIASPKAAERQVVTPAGLGVIDVHVDLTDWKGGRRFIGTATALGSLIFSLQRRRLDDVASPHPIGILTHHLIMDRETAGFLEKLTKLVAGHRAARWVDIAEMLR